MKKNLILAFSCMMLLSSCGGQPSSSEAPLSEDASSVATESSSASEAYDFKWVTPTGAPTLAFYDEGNNDNWVSASNPAEVVVPSFAANSYDAIVFDGVSGLNLMTKNAKAANYKLARWINNLGFYVVSLKHTKEELTSWNPSWTIDAFVKTGNCARVLMDLAKNSWNYGDISSQTTFETGLDAVVSNVPTNGYDFFVLADPAYTTLKGKLGDKLHDIYNLNEEWAHYHNGMAIPSAGLFVNAAKYEAHTAAYTEFLNKTDDRLTALVEQPQKAADALKEYAKDARHVSSDGTLIKFGFASTMAEKLPVLQKTNKFGFLKKGAVADNKAVANEFSKALGGKEFASSMFLA